MTFSAISLQENYWESFEFQDTDLEFLYNHLIEIETPQTALELLKDLVKERTRVERKILESKRLSGGEVYLPKNQHKDGQVLIFPSFNWQKGTVINIRSGINPDYPSFEVITVEFSNHNTHFFVSNFADHKLNEPVSINLDDSLLNPDFVIEKYGSRLIKNLDQLLQGNPDLTKISGRWFPRTLLVNINIGYLNLAEAVLEMEAGGPLTTGKIIEQIELPSDANKKLLEFSLNLALQEDPRFDEVGPSGETLWFLQRLEPDPIQHIPSYLKYFPGSPDSGVDKYSEITKLLSPLVEDELELSGDRGTQKSHIKIGLLYPFWRSGTLPLSPQLISLFPTAYESPRVRFTFIDERTGTGFSGWVVRQEKYVCGLEEWYKTNELIPGSIINLKPGKKPGEVIISTGKRRATRDWIRTAIIGADGGIVYAMLKQLISCELDERMAIFISDVPALDKIWENNNKQRTPLSQIIITTMRDLAKLNPQGQVHAQELYSAVNIIRRCPPGAIINALMESGAGYLGDLYFRFDDNRQEH